jgi:hypothetical protein
MLLRSQFKTIIIDFKFLCYFFFFLQNIDLKSVMVCNLCMEVHYVKIWLKACGFSVKCFDTLWFDPKM